MVIQLIYLTIFLASLTFVFVLQADCMDFEDTKWFDTLVFYGFKLQETIAKDDDDIRLLPSIVEKVVLPKLSGMVIVHA